MSSAIILPAGSLNIRVSGYLLTQFPTTGTYMSIARVNPLSATVEGKNRTITHIRNDSSLYQVDLTLLQGHGDDAFMQAAIRTIHATDTVLSFSFTLNATTYVSNSCDVVEDPARAIGNDNVENMTYMLRGAFPAVIVGRYNQPAVATADQILANVPA